MLPFALFPRHFMYFQMMLHKAQEKSILKTPHLPPPPLFKRSEVTEILKFNYLLTTSAYY